MCSPHQVRVAAARTWHPDMSNPDVHVVSPATNNHNPQLPKADWTYSTAYGGTFTGPWLGDEIRGSAECLPRCQLTDRSLPIRWFSQVVYYREMKEVWYLNFRRFAYGRMSWLITVVVNM